MTVTGGNAADTLKVNLDVTNENMTSFKGIGYSITADLSMGGYQAIKDNPASRKAFFEEFIGEAGFKNLVLWGFHWWYDVDTRELKTDYLNYFKDAMEYGGIKHVMWNPTEKYHKQGLHTPFMEQLNMQAEIVKALKDSNIDLYASTYLNKPNTNESGTFRQREDSVALGVKLYRHKLDSLGYSDVLLTAPTTVEWHPRNPNNNSGGDEYDYEDGDTERYLNAILNDEEAVTSLYAFDKQSYGEGMTSLYEQKANENGKEKWVMLSITETVGANDLDPSIPHIVSATLLSDINHGVSIWNTWLSYRLLNNDLSYKPLYYFLKNISRNFEYGAETRRCTLDPPSPSVDMKWNYYNHENPQASLQPAMNAAACKNPDGSWSIGLTNTTGIQAQHQIAATMPINPVQFRPIEVNIQVEELKDTVMMWFSVYESQSNGISKAGIVSMKNGNLKFQLNPLKSYVLRSDSTGIPIGGTSYPNPVLNGTRLSNYPNPFSNETSIEYSIGIRSEISIQIHDLSGRLVKDFGTREMEPGLHRIIWTGEDHSGYSLSSGIYILRFKQVAGNSSFQKQMKLLKVD